MHKNREWDSEEEWGVGGEKGSIGKSKKSRDVTINKMNGPVWILIQTNSMQENIFILENWEY